MFYGVFFRGLSCQLRYEVVHLKASAGQYFGKKNEIAYRDDIHKILFKTQGKINVPPSKSRHDK